MNKIFGIKLKELRTEKRLTQLQTAQIFNVSKTTICQWETSKQEPSLDDITAISTYFGVSSDYLLGLEDETGAKTYIRDSFNNFTNSGTIKF